MENKKGVMKGATHFCEQYNSVMGETFTAWMPIRLLNTIVTYTKNHNHLRTVAVWYCKSKNETT